MLYLICIGACTCQPIFASLDVYKRQVYDASGLTVSPGFVDGHVHFRDPGQTQKEDVLTGAAAAAAGGYATVICMANTVPTCDTPEIIRYVTDKAKDCPVPVSYTHLDVYKRQGVPAKTPYPGQWMAVRCREYCSIMGLMFTGRW